MATRRGLLCLGLLLGTWGTEGWAQGRGYGFSPTQLFLSSKATSAALTLKNQDASRTLRFQVTAHVWAQDAKGAMQLTKTEEILYFPRLFNLEPGKEQIIRVAAGTKPGPVEKTYRLMVEELPALAKPEDEGGAQISVRTRLAIPVFLQPDRPMLKGTIDAPAVRSRRLSFSLKNSGNVHIQAKEATVRGTGAPGEKIFEKKLQGWYVLTGGVREYELELSRADCIRTKKVTIEVPHEKGTFVAQVEVPAAACND